MTQIKWMNTDLFNSQILVDTIFPFIIGVHLILWVLICGYRSLYYLSRALGLPLTLFFLSYKQMKNKHIDT